MDPDEWLAFCARLRAGDTNAFTQSTQYLCLRKADGMLVGMAGLRHRLTEGLLDGSGQIGFCIHPDLCRMGYARQLVRLLLREAARMRMPRVIVCCDVHNEASRMTIISCGGEFFRIIPGDEPLAQYWLTTK